MADWLLALPFDTDDPEFRRGVEVGMLWQRLQTEPLPLHATVKGVNAEMVMRIAERLEISARCSQGTGAFVDVEFDTPR